MRITIKQRGGFAGGEIVLADVDTASLDQATRQSVEQQAQSAAVAGAARERPVGADLLTYELAVEDGGSRNGATWVDDGSAGAQPVKDLLDRLTQVG